MDKKSKLVLYAILSDFAKKKKNQFKLLHSENSKVSSSIDNPRLIAVYIGRALDKVTE